MNVKCTLAAAIVLITLLFGACSDDDGINEVRYSVTGNDITQFKISQGTSDKFVSTPFSGTKDTTIIVDAGTTVKLDVKGDNNNLVGSIYVNDELKAMGTDTDDNSDDKTQVKLEYKLP